MPKEGCVICSEDCEWKEIWENSLKDTPCEWLYVSANRFRDTNMQGVFIVGGDISDEDVREILRNFTECIKSIFSQQEIETVLIRGLKAIESLETYRKLKISTPQTWDVKYKGRMIQICWSCNNPQPDSIELNLPSGLREEYINGSPA